ncbi:MAG: hypothetical protein HPY53_11150 [Brevinematales bacterium]|nr:hypothetical protein [Brevinematales bacterium]
MAGEIKIPEKVQEYYSTAREMTNTVKRNTLFTMVSIVINFVFALIIVYLVTFRPYVLVPSVIDGPIEARLNGVTQQYVAEQARYLANLSFNWNEYSYKDAQTLLLKYLANDIVGEYEQAILKEYEQVKQYKMSKNFYPTEFKISPDDPLHVGITGQFVFYMDGVKTKTETGMVEIKFVQSPNGLLVEKLKAILKCDQ